MIAVTGASGKLGRLVVAGLLEKVAPNKIVAVVRSPDKVKDLAARGVLVRRGDYSSPETLGPALAGVERLVLISASEVGKRLEQHRAVVAAAKKANVALLVYTSLVRASTSGLALAAEHKATESEIRASGIPFVILRNDWYIENYTENLATPLAMGGFIGAAGTGKIAAASRADYAAAAVAVVTAGGPAGTTYELAGDRAFTMAELAEAVSAWAGKKIPYTNLPAPDYRKALVGAGLPEGFADFFTDVDVGIARGDLDSTSRDLHQLIGRSTETLGDVLARLPKP